MGFDDVGRCCSILNEFSADSGATVGRGRNMSSKAEVMPSKADVVYTSSDSVGM